jgi:hypothetical protein
MRTLVVVVVLFAIGCNEHGEGGAVFCLRDGVAIPAGESFSAGDGCNFCTCDQDGDISCSNDDCNGDGGPPIIVDAPARDLCAPSGGCVDGVECNGQCCVAGEQCVFGQCSCGGGSPCTGGDICATGGPSGGDACGSICCGQSGPCPL